MIQLKPKKHRKLPQARELPPPGPIRRILGWCVHGYTALGLVAAGLMAVLIVHGGPDAFRWSFLLMAIATIVDASDGTFARMVRIKQAVPSFDGRRLDDITDFLTYTFLPLLLIWRAQILPPGQEAWLLYPLVASAYGFCQVEAKTDDGYFLGFPSLWNLVALYLYVLPINTWAALAVVVVLATLTFVPTRHLYPSQPGKLNQIATILGVLWTPLVVLVIWNLPRGDRPPSPLDVGIAYASLCYPVFYLALSWAITINYWRKRFQPA